ncbi:hypothetical protein [Chamaesiphon sp. OTE_75_metabat_556]|uniref:hypothetical protein n=1 Tax=Chamaesiphon sp. OTE_75_metabat_556 TaxID=2964692 RepID=UPI00286C1DDC|nr:hypothetical protein [Chamaesiphon sp. OTE_75_metabat_556]
MTYNDLEGRNPEILERNNSDNLVVHNISQISTQHNATEPDRQIHDAYPKVYPLARHQKGLVHLHYWIAWIDQLE